MGAMKSTAVSSKTPCADGDMFENVSLLRLPISIYDTSTLPPFMTTKFCKKQAIVAETLGIHTRNAFDIIELNSRFCSGPFTMRSVFLTLPLGISPLHFIKMKFFDDELNYYI